MANRPVFMVKDGFVLSKNYSFEWFSGFALSQKQKSIASLHEAVGRPTLEVSTRSTEELGRKCSAFNLKVDGYTLENVFQSSKVFEFGGPYVDLLEVSPKEAKSDSRIRNSGRIIAFKYNDEEFPLQPVSVFYDYIYIRALKGTLKKKELKKLLSYECFTDIEFNPDKSINTQARSIALAKLMLMEFGEIPDFTKEEFISYHKEHVEY